MRWLRATTVLFLSVSVAGFGTCRRESGKENGDQKRVTELPASATSVSDPTQSLHPPMVMPPWAAGGGGATAPSSFAPLVKVAGDAVVTIVIKVKRKSGRPTMKGLGSGFFIDKEGTILTNNHVVSGGNTIEVLLANDKAVEGKVLGTDPMTDVAVVKIEPQPGINPIPLGDSDALLVGDWVLAIGNPLGLSHTVTAGILSARGRTTKDVPLKAMGGGDSYFDFLQTDAAINPGNSGGPLLNLKGEAIGINTAINAAGQGLAFAIPINMIKQMLPSLVKEGRVVRSYLGVGIEDAAIDEKTGLRGAVVMRVARGGPADKASLKLEDHIVAVDGTPVRDSSHLRWLVSIAGVGKKVTLRVLRDNKAFDLPVKLDKLPETKAAVEPGEDDDDDEAPPPPHHGHP
jgi:serine protease Do